MRIYCCTPWELISSVFLASSALTDNPDYQISFEHFVNDNQIQWSINENFQKEEPGKQYNIWKYKNFFPRKLKWWKDHLATWVRNFCAVRKSKLPRAFVTVSATHPLHWFVCFLFRWSQVSVGDVGAHCRQRCRRGFHVLRSRLESDGAVCLDSRRHSVSGFIAESDVVRGSGVRWQLRLVHLHGDGGRIPAYFTCNPVTDER